MSTVWGPLCAGGHFPTPLLHLLDVLDPDGTAPSGAKRPRLLPGGALPRNDQRYPWGFGGLGKAAAETSGDSVWLLVTEAHGIHRLASAADHPLQSTERDEETRSVSVYGP